jgi:precorrin-6B methylase 2
MSVTRAPSDPRAFELLALCARTRMAPDRAARVRGLVEAGVDLAGVVRQATQHGLVPLLARHLGRICPGRPEAAWLREQAELARRRNRSVAASVVEIARRLEEAGVPSASIGGPTMAALVYGDLDLRALSDAVILVRRRQVARAAAVLAALGYRPVHRLPASLHAAYLERWPRHAFLSDEGAREVQLFWSVGPAYGGWSPDESLWTRRQRVELGEGHVAGLGLEDGLLTTCVFAGEERWSRLGWLVDLAEIVTHHAVDYARLARVARRRGVARSLSLGLLLGADVLDAPVPEPILRAAREDARARALADHVRGRFMAGATDSPPRRVQLRVDLALRSGRMARLAYLARVAATPSPADWAFLPLPARLAFLYPVVRATRLVGARLGLWRVSPRLDLAPFWATPPRVVETMLDLASVGSRDVVVDLGCGDGRVVIAAARRGARAVGVDIDAARVEEARAAARAAGVERLVTLVHGDAKRADVSGATAVFLYLSVAGARALVERLLGRLATGARVVVHDADLTEAAVNAGWTARRRETVLDGAGVPHRIDVWTVGEPRRARRPTPALNG